MFSKGHAKETPERCNSQGFLSGYLSDLCLSNHLLSRSPTSLAITDTTKETKYFKSSTSFLAERADNRNSISQKSNIVKLRRMKVNFHSSFFVSKTIPKRVYIDKNFNRRKSYERKKHFQNHAFPFDNHGPH